MKTEQIIYSKKSGWTRKSDNELGNLAQLVFVFGNRHLLKNPENIAFIKESYPLAQLAGCSTSGEICQEEVFDENIICTAVWFEKTTIEIAEEKINSMNDSFWLAKG